MMGWHGYPAGGLELFGLLIIAVVGIMFFARRGAIRQAPKSWRNRSRTRSALEVAELRYARGDISRDEFLEISNDLYLTDSHHRSKRKRSKQ